ncbi:MAG: thioesterase family protein [Pseudomonadota bacterium]
MPTRCPTDMRVAVLGLGERGLDLAARAVAFGHDVAAFDPDPRRIAAPDAVVAQALAGLGALYDIALPEPGSFELAPGIADAVARADLILNAAPDRPAFQQKLIQAAFGAARPDVPLVCLARDLTLSDLRSCASRPADIAHLQMAAPGWLMPAARITGAPAASTACAALGLVAQEPDALTQARGLMQATGGETIAIIAALRSLKRGRHGHLGAALASHEVALAPGPPEMSAQLRTLDRRVPPDWADYNAHMNEQFYLTCFSDATDRLLLWAGMDAACVAQGFSVFTVETHIRHLGEVALGARITMDTRVIEGGGKRLHLWHELRQAGGLCATGEQLLLHMDLNERRVAPPPPQIAEFMAFAMQTQTDLPLPEGFGHHVNAPRS